MASLCFSRLAGRLALQTSCRQDSAALGRLLSTTATSNPEGATDATDATPPPVISAEEFNKLQEEKDKLLENVKQLDDKYKRSLADAENMRTRLTKQIEEGRVFGIQKFCKDLLEVADVLQTACATVPKEELAKSAHLKTLYEGLQMTESQLQTVFRRHGLTQINPIGEKFNPNEHEAVFMAEDKTKEVNSVAVVSKLGYRLKERVIRPALVGVVKH